jgi:hypothetical protein
VTSKSSIRPGRPVSIGSLIAIVFMVLFGVGFTVLVGNVLRENEAPIAMSVIFYLFMAGWLALALFMLVYHVKNLRRPGSMPLFEVELEAGPGGGAAEISPARKLRDLEQLKKDGLINQEEYSQKRAEIMAENW